MLFCAVVPLKEHKFCLQQTWKRKHDIKEYYQYNSEVT